MIPHLRLPSGLLQFGQPEVFGVFEIVIAQPDYIAG
jgi:hypothetical protein